MSCLMLTMIMQYLTMALVLATVAASVTAFVFILFDVNYFLRMSFTVLFGRLFQKKSGLNETTSIYGFCTTQDVDWLLTHMNNARYVRELDFARVHFYDRTGINANIKAVSGSILQGASSIRYRRTIPIFSAYKIETKLAYWEDKSIFLEQKFVTFDGLVRTIAWSRQSLIDVDAATLLKNLPGAEVKPECPPEIKQWIQAMEVSRAQLKKDD